MDRSEIINWLLGGDVSVKYQTHRDLLISEGRIHKIKTDDTGVTKLNSDKNYGVTVV
jgi:hypothetical protein